MIAVVMCGGAGLRLDSGDEKPMTKLAGRYYIERVLSALEKSGRFERIMAAVSPKTPETRRFLISRGITIIDTKGEGYSQDLQLLLAKLSQEKVLVVPADIPLLNPITVCEAMDLLVKARGPAASLVIEKSFVEKLGIIPSIIVGDFCHSGITLFDEGITGMVDEFYVTMNRLEIAVNVNTKEEKELAELLVKRGDYLAKDFGF